MEASGIYLPLVILFGYLAGSIPTAVIIAKRFGGIDVFSEGSGNPGASNVFRLMGFKWAVVVMTIDIFKGFIPVYLVGQFHEYFLHPIFARNYIWVMLWAGAGAVVGHLLPLYTKFRGGKGVATSGGVMLALAPMASSVVLMVWAVVLYWKRTFSVASLVAACVFPLSLYCFEGEQQKSVFMWSLIVPVMLFATHRSNLKRLWQGEEFPMNENEENGPN